MADEFTTMSQAQIDAFLETPRFAVVGTNRTNGPPQLTPVWYLYENDQIYIWMFVKSAKYRNLSRDPRISICIAGSNPDARAVMFTGTAELVAEGGDRVDEIVWRLARRYCGSDEETRSYLDSSSDGGKGALAIVTPDKVIAEDYN